MLSRLDKDIIRRLQEELPVERQPYKTISEELGITEEVLLNRIHYLQDSKIIRRLGAILYHRKAGFTFNAMVVWAVPHERCDEVGGLMASSDRVSHCYKRAACANWPYNMYTMVHGHSSGECEEIASGISKETGIDEYEILYSTMELKKTSMKYFV